LGVIVASPPAPASLQLVVNKKAFSLSSPAKTGLYLLSNHVVCSVLLDFADFGLLCKYLSHVNQSPTVILILSYRKCANILHNNY